MCFLSIYGMHAQNIAHKIIDQIKYQDGSLTLTVPKWLVKKISKETIKLPDSTDYNTINQIRKNIGKVRLTTLEKSNHFAINPQDLYDLVAIDKYELYSKVKDDGDTFSLYLKSKDDIINNLFILHECHTEIMAMNVDLKIDLTQFEKLNLSFNKEKHESKN